MARGVRAACCFQANVGETGTGESGSKAALYMTHSKHGSDIMSFLRVLLVRSKSQAPHPPGTQGRQEAIQGHECSRQDRGGYLSALLVSSEAKNK